MGRTSSISGHHTGVCALRCHQESDRLVLTFNIGGVYDSVLVLYIFHNAPDESLRTFRRRIDSDELDRFVCKSSHGGRGAVAKMVGDTPERVI